MFDKISNSWRLVKASAAVLMADKELLIFPVISAIGALIVSLTFAFPLFLSGFFENVLGGQGKSLGSWCCSSFTSCNTSSSSSAIQR